MTVHDWTDEIHQGDAAEVLPDMPLSSVHSVMTSPPYWQLRDYGKSEQLGLEESVSEYVSNLCDILDAVKRVLRSDGSLWLNLGDTYQDKQLQQVPARVAIELQSRGWVLRNRVTWSKPNPMPSSVKDRLNTTTEALFHLTPSKSYWYDLDSIREDYAESYSERAEKGYQHKHGDASGGWGQGDHNHAANHHDGGILDNSGEYGDNMHPEGKNPGDLFEVTTKPFPDAHFAVYPPELCEKPLRSTCPPKVCSGCGTPYTRDVEVEPGEYEYSERGEKVMGRTQVSGTMIEPPEREHIGWVQECECTTDSTLPGITLDPFAGAGTTLMVAEQQQKRWIGVELNEDYVDMAYKRLREDANWLKQNSMEEDW